MTIIVGASFLIVGLGIVWSNFSARHYWTETHGIVTKLDLKNEQVEYEYSVNGRQYTGSSGDDPNWNRAGRSIRIYYDKNDPSTSRHHNWANEIIFGWTFAASGFGLLALGWIT
jgi:hypothetical protein